jgi:PST family polysaccharide transporter
LGTGGHLGNAKGCYGLKPSQSIAQRSVASVSWNSAANLIKVAVFFVRSVLLARLLPVEVFGVYALAGSIVTLSVIVPNFGMGGAFLHRAPETEDEEHAAAVHFTLKLIFTLIWAALLVVGALFFTSGQMRTALLLMVATAAGIELAQTPSLILVRRVVHRRLALILVLNAFLTTMVALTLAWKGVTLWALLSTDVVTLVLTILLLYVWRPVWRPRVAWSLPTMCYFLRFGSRNFLATVLLKALDRVDDLWTGFYLGNAALGFYSRAYSFATYPRSVLAAPIGTVSVGTYAELKDDRRRLSQAFFRTNAFLVRSGFLLAGLLALIAPEFIRILLTEKWLPMLEAFRLMLVFTLFDPMKTAIANLFVAVGRPEQVVRIRLVQLSVMVIGLLVLTPLWGIAGVALAVDAMLIVGIALLLWRARTYVDYSPRRMFLVPSVAIVVGISLSLVAVAILGSQGSDWWTGAVKAGVFVVVYFTVLVSWERDQLALFASMLGRLYPKRR